MDVNTRTRGESWSEWMETLPEGITADNHIIETKTLYSYSDTTEYRIEDGKAVVKELVLKDTEYSDWGEWSEWQLSIKDGLKASDTVEIESTVVYSYRDKAYDESDSGSWTLWSAWTDKKIEASATKEVQTRQTENPNKPIYQTLYQYSRAYMDIDGERVYAFKTLGEYVRE